MVTWHLTPEEAQFVINQVANLPYSQVSGLVEKLVSQARTSQAQQQQLQGANGAQAPQPAPAPVDTAAPIDVQ